jgi:hypothetical protein
MAVTWIVVDAAYVLGAMPTALRAEYDAWLVANPAKAGRLAAIVSGVVAGFRDCLNRDPSVDVSTSASYLADHCTRHAVIISCYLVALEMGTVLGLDMQLAYAESEKYLRWLRNAVYGVAAIARYKGFLEGQIPAEEEATPTPSYAPRIPWGEL